ncbi:Protein of unknown function (DUF3211) [Metallosphaera yellowstonensis MK1]|jgi:hypothetical protein|uniref:Polyketide cyclase / dehydrase and lipid transport n=1 Tax=Metallosphaera yellowstonensis MK1 TaxID=671065 RepID=H2C1D9_9CREN|nr:DUF3211 domain-containing protein [Metallosphaera yellowstonensis]EHP70060.1 Protein of unknown function (DUF3211) [Metallosphaera yellowstonensis MK1]
MKYIAEIGTEHPQESIRALLSDPHFVIPRVFKSVKEFRVEGSSFRGVARYFGFEHEVLGNVYSSVNEVSYPFTLRHGVDVGTGRLTFLIQPGSVRVILEYEGWMERFSRGILKGWVRDFLTDFEEVVRMERIKRRL